MGSTTAPALLVAQSACHVCRINNASLHFYDATPNGCYAVIYPSRVFHQDYDSGRENAGRATRKSSHSDNLEEPSRLALFQPLRAIFNDNKTILAIIKQIWFHRILLLPFIRPSRKGERERFPLVSVTKNIRFICFHMLRVLSRLNESDVDHPRSSGRITEIILPVR